jgi:hypothetical protein
VWVATHCAIAILPIQSGATVPVLALVLDVTLHSIRPWIGALINVHSDNILIEMLYNAYLATVSVLAAADQRPHNV